MSKEKAIEICKNLTKTIKSMTKSSYIKHKNEVFEIPRCNKSALERRRRELINKYSLNK